MAQSVYIETLFLKYLDKIPVIVPIEKRNDFPQFGHGIRISTRSL